MNFLMQIIYIILLVLLAILLIINRDNKLKWLHRVIFIIVLAIFVYGVLTP